MKLVKALVYLAFLLLTQSVHGKKCRCKTNMNTIAKAQSSMEELTSRVDELEEKENKRAIVKESGATYVRWGKTNCSNVTGAMKVYEGYAAGSYHNYYGGGVDLLCLPKEPTWGEYSDAHIGHSYIYGAELRIFGADSERLFGKKVGEQNIPCVVCQSVGRPAVLRIPGRTNCYAGWTTEYTGYLLSGHYNHKQATDYTCIDSDPEFVAGKAGNQNGYLLYPVEANCAEAQGLQCPPYKNGRELACVVCTK